MLSPNWAYLWPSANQPKAYNTDKLVKYAILMTDGEYNTMYCNGAQARNSNGPDINCNATNGQVLHPGAHAVHEDEGEGDHRVHGRLPARHAELHRYAAAVRVEPDKFFNAEDGVTLKLAFQAIALQIAKLSLSH